MRKALLVFLLLYIVLSFSTNVAVAMNMSDLEKIRQEEQLIMDERKNQILVKYKDNVPRAEVRSASMSEIVEKTQLMPGVELLRIKEEVDANQLVNKFREDKSVEVVELNGVSHLMGDVIVSQKDLEGKNESKSTVLDATEMTSSYRALLDSRLVDNEGQEEYTSEDDIVGKHEELLEKVQSKRTLSAAQNLTSDTVFEVEPNNTYDYADRIEIDNYVYGTITDVYYDLDYYELDISSSGNINILGVFDYPEYLAIGLLDERGNTIAWSRLFNGQSQYLQKKVATGTYYIVVFQTSDSQYLCTNESYLFQTWMTDVESNIPVSSISLNKTDMTLYVGNSEILNATIYPANATNKSVTWLTSNPSVATVDTDGRVTAEGEGSAVVTAKTLDGGKTASCDVHIKELPTNSGPAIVNDSYYDKQWWLDSVKAPGIWQKITGSNPVVVAVIDSGIDLNHEDLINKVAKGGYNFIFNNYDVYDANGHGTAVSGVIAAEANNYKGITGVTGPLNIKVLPLQASFYDGTFYTSDVIRAVEYAIDHDVDVINMSFGGSGYSSILNAAIQEAINKGIVVVASAGNDGDSSYIYPACYENVIAVGATSPSAGVSSFSNHNDQVDFVAPGEYIFTTQRDNSYGYMAGTSFSAPIVSGVASLMKVINQSLTPREITGKLAEDALDEGRSGKDDYYGYGLINTYDTVIKLVSNLDTDYTELPEKVNVPMNKGWKITFNLKLNSKTVSNERVYIKNANNSAVQSSVQMDGDAKSILITPLENYSYGQEYYLYIEDEIESDNGVKLRKPVRMKFSIGSQELMGNEGEIAQTYEVLSF